MKTIVRIVTLFVLCFGLLVSAGSAAFAQSTGDEAVTTSDEVTTDEATNPEASPVAPIGTPETDEGASTTDEGDFSPATIGEQPGGDYEDIEGTIRLTSDVNTGDGYAYVSLPVPDGATFAGLQALGADLLFDEDDTCAGGSPRFSIGVDVDGDGSRDGSVFVYIGPGPNFTGCSGALSTGNLLDSGDARFDTSQVGGGFYTTYGDALALLGSAKVVSLSLVVDGGWTAEDGEQTVYVQSVTGIASAFEGISNLRVIKTKDTTSGPVVPGACFTIFAYGEGGVRGDEIAAEQCDDDLDGNVDFTNLPALTALIVAETVAPEGYAAGADFPVTLAEGDNFIGFPNSLLPDPTATATATATSPATETATATTAPASPTATSTGSAEPTSTTSTNPSPTGTTTVTTLPSTGTGTGSSSSLGLGLIAALLTLVVISGGYLVSKRRNA